MTQSKKFSPELRERAIRMIYEVGEVRELKRANEILKVTSAFFAQAELDRRLK